MPTPEKLAEWMKGADSDGALLVRDPLVDKRTITARVRLSPQSTMNLALAAIEGLSQKLEECEQWDDGLPLVWTPADSSLVPLTFYVLSGSFTGLPVTVQGDDAGWFVKAPVVTIKLDCKPFGYEDEVLFGSSTTSSAPLITLALTSIPGDVPAEGRLIVTDMASQSRAHVEWGVEQRFYNAGSPDSLLIDSDSMTTSGYTGTQTTRTGAYDPNASGNNVIRGTLVNSPSTVCSTGNLAHIGTFRMKLRCYCTSANVQVRLAWKDGDSPYSRNAYAQAVTVGWNDLDLGLITVPTATLGTQRWAGVFEAYSSTGSAGDTIDVDVLEMMPAGEGYGKARTPLDLTTVTTFSALDDFEQTAGALTAKTLPIGGTWQGAGDADDFQAQGTPNFNVRRTAASDAGTSLATGRIVTATTPTSMTNTHVRSSVQGPVGTSGQTMFMGVVARYASVSNFVACYVNYSHTSGVGSFTLNIVKRVSGTDTLLATGPTAYATGNPAINVRFTVLANGAFYASFAGEGLSGGGPNVDGFVSGTDSALATGGGLASGTAGLYDRNTNATAYVRGYDFFRAYVPAIDNVMWSGQSVEFRYDGVLREDSTGTYYGPVRYRGKPFLIPPAGDKGRTARVAVKARRNDVDLQPDDNIADSTKIEVRYRARHLNVRGS